MSFPDLICITVDRGSILVLTSGLHEFPGGLFQALPVSSPGAVWPSHIEHENLSMRP